MAKLEHLYKWLTKWQIDSLVIKALSKAIEEKNKQSLSIKPKLSAKNNEN